MSAGRILAVDDDPQIRRVMRVTLSGERYEIDEAKGGEEALEKLRAERFDLVLLDMNMPEMGGLECCRLIRAQSEIAIIMLTVRDSESDTVESYAEPAFRAHLLGGIRYAAGLVEADCSARS